jgi:hypothetical protein
MFVGVGVGVIVKVKFFVVVVGARPYTLQTWFVFPRVQKFVCSA